MNKNKVLIIHAIGYPYGIAEDFLHKEILYLSENFSKIVLITRDTTSSERRDLPQNCEVIRVELSNGLIAKLLSLFNLFSLLFWREIFLILKEKKSLNKVVLSTILISLSNAKKLKKSSEQIGLYSNDALYYYSYWCDDAALGLAMLHKKDNIKTFCRIHRWDIYFEQNANDYLPFRSFISKHLDAIYSISEDGINYVKNHWNIQDFQKVKLARLGVHKSSDFSPKMNFNYMIVSCSNLIPVKNVHILAEALKQITSIDIRWIHFGDGIEKERINDITNAFPVNIKFEMRGSVKNEDIISFYKTNSPDLFINVSSSEGIPVSIMEAMSFGIPVIATNVGGTSEIVTSKNGFLLDADFSILDLVDIIKSFYAMNSSDLRQMQEHSFQTWKNEYNAETNYKEFVKILLNS